MPHQRALSARVVQGTNASTKDRKDWILPITPAHFPSRPNILQPYSEPLYRSMRSTEEGHGLDKYSAYQTLKPDVAVSGVQAQAIVEPKCSQNASAVKSSGTQNWT